MKEHSKPIAGIYDRWLSTLGGGEQVAFAYAQSLYEMGYQVDLLTHKKVDSKQAELKMGISLENFNFRYLEEASSSTLSGISENYDIFINTSHLDYFPNRSEKGILSVFFPGLLKLNPYEYLKRAFFIPSFRKFFIYPSRYEGFSHDQYSEGTIYKWLSNESSIVFFHSIRKISFTLHFTQFSFSVIDSLYFTVNEKRTAPVMMNTNHMTNSVDYTLEFPEGSPHVVTIHLPKHPYASQVALTRLTIPSYRYFLYNIFKKFFPVYEMRLHGGPGVTKLSDLTSYNKIVTISRFCQRWISRYWALPSEILYPPVNTDNFFPAKHKKNIILHVGRFFISGHSKKQLALAKVFKHMRHKYGVEDWELHFVGSVEEGENHQHYFKQVQNEATGEPIFFHTQMPFVSLQKLFSESKIYWHATGLDEDEEKNPGAFEHFGITTVEAMASGCVPVVINAGGQPEIVTPDAGFTWKTTRELMELTVKLIHDDHLLLNMSAAAKKRSEFFSRDRFKKRFKELLK